MFIDVRKTISFVTAFLLGVSPVSAEWRIHPPQQPHLRIVGDVEVVFEWERDRCQDENIPDAPSRAFRDAGGETQLILSHYVGYRMRGPSLNNLAPDCQEIMNSHRNADPSAFSDAEWIHSPYTEDGETVYALVHNEYQGNTHTGMCPQGEYRPCWYNAITLAKSTDGGRTFQDAYPPPGHLVAAYPYPYMPGAGPNGYFSPSNIIRAGDGFYYAIIGVTTSYTHKGWSCLMRTDDLANPGSWRYWDGAGFNGEFTNPYATNLPGVVNGGELCSPLENASGESLTYNTHLDKYVLIGITFDKNRKVGGIYYSFSADLIHWSSRQLLVEVPLLRTVRDPSNDIIYAYPSLLDSQSKSRNYETTGRDAWLYITRFNQGRSAVGGLDRDLIRVPVRFSGGKGDQR